MANFLTPQIFFRIFKSIFLFLAVLCFGNGYSQKTTANKYPSLFWEITGNGLKKPSYLFGTMHVSNKMVFNLSDSFYYAMKNVDAVALELNPDVWQGQMVQLDQFKQNYVNFVKTPGEDFLTENSFRINKYDDELKAALSTEPTVVNSLLYRSYKAREDFEEDTFLDMYIFQTGKKLGKRSAGVEDFYETEKIVLQAYADMATEKKKKSADLDGESMKDISQKTQDAYRRGDLDLMDSLDNLTEKSEAFRESFLYRRNEVQANSIDTIVKKSSLFVGVGAAHLPGPRGVIELLRKKGYRLRPIKMPERDAIKKEGIDQLKVPVVFANRVADDGLYSVDMPGPLFKMADDFQQLDRRQYADMNNGSYYMVTRVKTHGTFTGQSTFAITKKIDSMLYENVPGKIVQKTAIEKNGFKGFDITNRTRRGDLQRYNIFITPFEVLFFKMSGKENYVSGEEANRFFTSIQLKKTADKTSNFSPKQGGFTIALPQQPHETVDGNNADGIDRWEYEAMDSTNGDGYLVQKKNVYNFKFLEEDSFNLKLIETSFRSPDLFDKQLQRRQTSFNGYPCLDTKEKMKDGRTVFARFIIKGPEYFVVAVSSKNASKNFSSYFSSFHFTPYLYPANKIYTDSFMHFNVNSPVEPHLNDDYRSKLENVSQEIAESKKFTGNNNFWPKSRNAVFTSDSTGEMIAVSIQKYPPYYYIKDSTKFWTDQLNKYVVKNELLLYSKDSFILASGVSGYNFVLRDSGSSQTIIRKLIRKDNYLFSLVTIGDTLNQQSNFIASFFNGFTPQQKKIGRPIFNNNIDSFFTDLFSKDSTTFTRAQQAIPNIYFGEKAAPKIMAALQKMTPSQKGYFNTKAKLIAELGFINDSLNPVVVNYLKRIYQATADTSIFQNEVVTALAKHKTAAAMQLFKELVLQDPPVFDKSTDYSRLFNNLDDSLELAARLYPELLQLATLTDYKAPVTSLLVKLVDSGFVKGTQYQTDLSKIYFDAKIALKKQQAKEEKKLAEEKTAEDNFNMEMPLNMMNRYYQGYHNEGLKDYIILLMPFYNTNANVPKFFDQLLKLKEDHIAITAAVALLRNKQAVADSILLQLAANDRTRGDLYSRLEKANRLDKFPLTYQTPLSLAKSYLAMSSPVDSIVYLSKQLTEFNHKKGNVYFFKYRIKKEDDWKIGISGLQPANDQQVSSNDKLCFLSDKKLKFGLPQQEQLQEQLQKLLLSFHKAAKNFYENDGFGFKHSSFKEEEE